MPIVVVTRLRLRDPALLDEFFTAAVTVLEQATNSPGNLGADVLADANNAWWTLILQLPFHGEWLTSTSLVTRDPRSRLRRVADEADVTIGTQAGGGDTRGGRGSFP